MSEEIIPLADALNPIGYNDFLREVKERVRTSQVRAGLAVNSELVLLYWSIGRDILARQRTLGWGAKVIDRLGTDLRRDLPNMQGFSPRNLKYMRSFADAWPEESMVQGPLAQITWYHNITLLEKVKQTEVRLWYARQTVENGWSRPLLVHQIESLLHERLVDVAGQDWYLDMLFYHLKLRCYVVVELKATDFKPEYAGKMQFYLSAVDDTLRRGDDAPSIGLILCRTKNRTVVEYTLRDTTRPIGVSQFQIAEALPDNLKGSLPTIEQIEAELMFSETEYENADGATSSE